MDVPRRDGDELLEMPEISRLTRTPEGTLRYWRHIGQGPPLFKLARLVCWRSDLMAWLADQQAATQTGATTP